MTPQPLRQFKGALPGDAKIVDALVGKPSTSMVGTPI
jgi:hypothetical protein